jgi:hypothetical protein
VRDYINQNLYQECQLIAALNAYRFLRKRPFCEQGDDTYEELVDLVMARNGSAIGIEKAYRKLGIKKIGELDFSWSVEDLFSKLKLPVQMTVWHKRTGFHCCLIVGYLKRCRAFQVANFREVTTAEGWVFAEDLYQWDPRVDLKPKFAVFGLRGQQYRRECRLIKQAGELILKAN